MISQARVMEQMLQLHFEVGVVVRSRWQVKVIREQWQEPLYSLGAIVVWFGFSFAFVSFFFLYFLFFLVMRMGGSRGRYLFVGTEVWRAWWCDGMGCEIKI